MFYSIMRMDKDALSDPCMELGNPLIWEWDRLEKQLISWLIDSMRVRFQAAVHPSDGHIQC
jgi:hypothetical protein